MNLSSLAAMAGVLLMAGAALDRCAPVIGASAQLKRAAAETARWEKAARDWEAYGRAEKKAFDESERLRGVEVKRAAKAVAEQALACEARVTAARASAARIAAIVTKEPARDPQGCPIRQLFASDELRDAVVVPGRR